MTALPSVEEGPEATSSAVETDGAGLSSRDVAVGLGIGLASIALFYTRFKMGSIRRRLSRERRLREDLHIRLRHLRDELEAARDEILQQEAHIQELDRSRAMVATESLVDAPQAESQSADNTFVFRVVEAIGDGIAEEDFNVDELARRLAIDRSHLYRKLRALLGTTPSDLIRSIRLQQAATLLGNKVGTVSEIAYQVGFRSVSQFSRSFRNRYGMPPSAYQGDGRPQDGSGTYSLPLS